MTTSVFTVECPKCGHEYQPSREAIITEGRSMIATRPRRTPDGQVPVYGSDGTQVATVNPARSTWMGTLLAECERHHVYLLDDDLAGCPVCNPPDDLAGLDTP